MKYRLTEETIEVFGITLYRIECVEGFNRVKAGDKGGYVESERNLSQYGNAWVFGNAKVYGYAKVHGNAEVYGDAEVCDNARVFGNAEVCDNAKVCGNAEVYGDAWVCGNARVYGYAWVYGNAEVCDNARVYGIAWVYGNAEVYGNAWVCGNAKVCGDADYIVFKNNWSSGRYFTWTRSNNMWRVGCFFGTGDELIKKAFADSENSGKHYEAYVKFVEQLNNL